MDRDRGIIVTMVAFFFAVILSYSFAQNNQTESLSIVTYFPAPFGVYKNPRIYPQEKPVTADERQPGTLYFNNSEQKLYIFSGALNDWEKLGSGLGSSANSFKTGLKIYSGHHVSPDVCLNPTYYSGQLCDWDGWFKTITFPQPFTKIPRVMVTIERAPDVINSSCTDFMGDSILAQVIQVTLNNFQVMAGSSPQWWSTCGHPPYPYEGHRSRAEIGWIAIGE